jgi:DNA-binding IclR family transcriptional regulator
MGTAFVAWASPSARQAWLDRLGPRPDEETLAVLDRTLKEVRETGYSVARGHRWHSQAAAVLSREQPGQHQDETAAQMHQLIATLPADYESPDTDADDVRTVSMPVFGPGGVITLVLSVTVPGHRSLGVNLPTTLGRLRAAAGAVTQALGGVVPEGVGS